MALQVTYEMWFDEGYGTQGPYQITGRDLQMCKKIMETKFRGTSVTHPSGKSLWFNTWGTRVYDNIPSQSSSTSNNNDSSSYSSSGSTEALFGLIGLGVVGTYHLTKFTVVSSYKVTKFTVNKVVVPTTKFTFNNVVVPSAKYTWKGMKYVATTTVPQVYSFTKNTVIPGVVKLASDIIEFLTELVNKVMGKTTNYPKVQSQYRKEVI